MSGVSETVTPARALVGIVDMVRIEVKCMVLISWRSLLDIRT